MNACACSARDTACSTLDRLTATAYLLSRLSQSGSGLRRQKVSSPLLVPTFVMVAIRRTIAHPMTISKCQSVNSLMRLMSTTRHWLMNVDTLWHLDMVATDGHRLALAESEASYMSPNMKLVVPAFALRLMASCFDSERSVYIAKEESHVFFTCGDVQIVARPVAGTFPDYERVMPRSNGHTLTVNRTALLDAVKVAEKNAPEPFRTIALKLNGCCRVEAKCDERKFAADVPAKWDGLEDWRVLVNASYLREWLESQVCDTAVIRLKQERSRGKDGAILSVDSDVEKHGIACYCDPGVESVIMPQRM